MRTLSYADLRSRQDAPWASIGFGAAGIAAALVRCAPRASRREHVALAERWLDAAAAGSRARGAFLGSDDVFTTSEARASLHFGAAGIALVRALARAGGVRGAGSSGADAGIEASIGEVVARSRRARGSPPEFILGRAGHLSGLLVLERATGAPAVTKAADTLAEGLLAEARGAESWTRGSALGFAHGRAGIFHALLGWSLARGQALPDWFFVELERLAEDVERGGTLGAPAGIAAPMQRSWCNGAAGFVLCWVRAHEATGHRGHLRRARSAAAVLAQSTEDASGDLCCGLGGRAYALLALERVEPGRWEDRARKMAARASDAAITHAGRWPNGLYKGFPGLVCLSHELMTPARARRGFPLVEG